MNEQTVDIHSNVNGSHKHGAKAGTKEFVLHGTIYIKSKIGNAELYFLEVRLG